MRTGLSSEIRKLLTTNPDGMTTKQIAEITKREISGIRQHLHRMPDTYRDRWIPAKNSQYEAVWCIVVPPPDCPHPQGKHERKEK